MTRTLGYFSALSLALLVACSGEAAPVGSGGGGEEGDAPALPDPTPAQSPSASDPPPQSVAGITVTDAMNTAKSGLGFSYWWGGGCWSPGASSKGSCTGSCPSCTHSGTWGADCSGYVAKAWQVPKASATTTCSHPYSTDTFYNEEREWTTIPRSQVKRGDAFVYRKGGSGHIFLYDSGDAWGYINALEAKGCSYGILADSRTASSDYKVIRRTGF